MVIDMNFDETKLLDLLRDLQAALGASLDSLGGKTSGGLVQSYLVYSAIHTNKAVEGYINLRDSGRIDASKLLIRPALEACIRMLAVGGKPEMMFRIAFSEFGEDKKWARPLGQAESIAAIDQQWQDFKKTYAAKYPQHPLNETTLSLLDAAQSVGLEKYYDSHFRLYCRFTHAAFRAITGDLDNFDPVDNRTMAFCTYVAIDVLRSIGASAAGLAEFKQRLNSL